MKRLTLGTALGLVALFFVACSDGKNGDVPSEDLAQKEFSEWFEDDFGEYLSIISFKKTNGQMSDADGVRRYAMHFEGTVLADRDVFWKLGGSNTEVAPFADIYKQMVAKKMMGMRDPRLDRFTEFAPVFEGEEVRLAGEIRFEDSEDGWLRKRIALSGSEHSADAEVGWDALHEEPVEEEVARLATELEEWLELSLSLFDEGRKEEFLDRIIPSPVLGEARMVSEESQVQDAIDAAGTSEDSRGYTVTRVALMIDGEVIADADSMASNLRRCLQRGELQLRNGGDIALFYHNDRMGIPANDGIPDLFIKKDGEWKLGM